MTRHICVFASLLIALFPSPCVADGAIRFVNPDGLFKPSTFTQITVTRGERVVLISGQTARDEMSQIVAIGDVQRQTEKAIENLRIAVESVGGSMADIAKITTYIVNLQPEDRLWIGKMVREKFPTPPAHTLIGISALAAPELLVEIEAIAVLD